jgi:hypothetical protein
VAIIVTQNGAVLLKGGRASCTCCDELPLEDGLEIKFLEAQACDCDTVTCYRGPNYLSPASVFASGIAWSNRTPTTTRFTPDIPSASVGGLSGLFIQYPILEQVGGQVVYRGYRNVVRTPTIVRLTGQIGGDIEVDIRALGEPQTWDNGLNLDNFVPQEGEFPCGSPDTCLIPRNGPHNIDYLIALYPNMFFYLQPFSYLRCFPFINLRLRAVRPVAFGDIPGQCIPTPQPP